MNLPITLGYKVYYDTKDPYNTDKVYAVAIYTVTGESYLYLEFSDVERPDYSFYLKNKNYSHAFSSDNGIPNIHQECKKEEAEKIIISWLNAVKRKYAISREEFISMKRGVDDSQLEILLNSSLVFSFMSYNNSLDWYYLSRLIDMVNIKEKCSINAAAPLDLEPFFRTILQMDTIYNADFFDNYVSQMYKSSLEEVRDKFNNLGLYEVPYVTTAISVYFEYSQLSHDAIVSIGTREDNAALNEDALKNFLNDQLTEDKIKDFLTTLELNQN